LSKRVAVKYVDGQRLTADIYAPTRHGLFPIVVQIYGGAWRGGQPSDNAKFATWLASAGYLVVAIDYRHAPAHHWPAQIEDVDDALRWVVAHATDFDGDTSRVVLLGRSSGAHLATYAAWITSPIHLRGVVSLYGPADLVTAYQFPPRPDPIHVRAVEEALIGGTLAQLPAKYADASTITHLASLAHPPPPTLLMYGRRDHIVEAKYGAGLRAALTRAGGDVTYLELPWADHAFDEVFSGPSSQISMYYIERFLARVMAS
jgi:acetyl esterase/lipase